MSSQYSWYSSEFIFMDDNRNVVMIIPRTTEVPLSEQNFTPINSITWYK
jgi:hypothetical protein